MYPPVPCHSTRGNVLFLILIAVALFAALAYAVTSSSRSGDGKIDDEQAKSQAAVILQYFSSLDIAVQRMTVDGIPIEQLDWYAPGIAISNNANSICLSDKCKVFHPAGGGVSPMALPLAATDPNASSSIKTSNGQGSTWALIGSVKNIGTSSPEGIFAFRGVKKAVCDEINIAMGLMNKGDADISESGGAINTDFRHFHGTNTSPWPTTLTPDYYGGTDSRIAGKATFCRRQSVSNGYYVFHVIYPR